MANYDENQIKDPQHIVIETEQGSLEGYCIGIDQEQPANWLQKNGLDTSIINVIRHSVTNVAFLNNMNIQNEHQGNGHGKEMLFDFLTQCSIHNVDVVLLIADTGESQREGFNIVQWYKRFGFTQMNSEDFPLMMKVIS